jgi:hypothetical protein
MLKNILLIILMATILVFVGTMNKSAKAVEDPVEAIKNAKTPVHLHSLAGGDSLVHELPTMVGTWWQSIHPPSTFGATWYVQDERLDTIPGLTPSDKLELRYYDTLGVGHDSVWVNVEDMTISFFMEALPPHDTATYYFESVQSYNVVGDSFVYFLALKTCDTLHQVTPHSSPSYHVTITETDTTLEPLDKRIWGGDTLTVHVMDVAIGISVLSIPGPTVPTMTQWGVIILAALIVAGAIFIILRRRKATVPA